MWLFFLEIHVRHVTVLTDVPTYISKCIKNPYSNFKCKLRIDTHFVGIFVFNEQLVIFY